MVVFTCQNCGDSIQKPKVEKHYNSKCRNKNINLTCVDCLKDFFGQEYNSHTKCVTEMERYSATGSVPKEKKGETKQAQFVDIISSLLNSKDLTQSQRMLLSQCSKFENVPRKRPKFINFVKNALRHFHPTPQDVDSIFDILESAWKESQTKSADKENLNNKTPDINGGKNSLIENNQTHEEVNHMDVDNVQSKTNKKKKIKKNSSLDKDISKEIEDCSEPKEETKDIIEPSKKILKKQKKREKYVAELENETKNHTDECMDIGENIPEKSKKKYNKLKNDKSQSNLTVQLNEVQSINDREAIFKKDSIEKGKKRKLEEPTCDTLVKRIKDSSAEGDESINQGAFDWADVIIRVLDSRPDKELSLKRLGKKVINEYHTVKPDHRTYEELLAKFNKKIKKTKGVKVLKDKAKLVQEL